MSNKEECLYQVSEAQQGYFTARQAVACGYPTSSHVYHLKVGTWQREYRGIYRLTRFPPTDHAQYVLWSLWSRNRQGVPQGVYSHQTALSLFDLSDLMPARLHMTVPPAFRRNSPTPKVLVLHRGGIVPDEMEERQGFRVDAKQRRRAGRLELTNYRMSKALEPFCGSGETDELHIL